MINEKAIKHPCEGCVYLIHPNGCMKDGDCGNCYTNNIAKRYEENHRLKRYMFGYRDEEKKMPKYIDADRLMRRLEKRTYRAINKLIEMINEQEEVPLYCPCCGTKMIEDEKE